MGRQKRCMATGDFHTTLAESYSSILGLHCCRNFMLCVDMAQSPNKILSQSCAIASDTAAFAKYCTVRSSCDSEK